MFEAVFMKKKLYYQTRHPHNFNPPIAKYQYIGTPLNQYNDLQCISMSLSTGVVQELLSEIKTPERDSQLGWLASDIKEIA